MRDRNLPQLKRFWFCDLKHAETGGCSCKKLEEVLCQSIAKIPETHIDKIRAQERLKRLPRPSAFWGNERERSLRPDFHAAMRMAFHDGELIARIASKHPNPQAVKRENPYASLTQQMSRLFRGHESKLGSETITMRRYTESELRKLYETPPIMMDEVHHWPHEYDKSKRVPLYKDLEPYIEGKPDKPKPWHTLIEPNHRKKPR